MIHIHRVYTKAGDNGNTFLVGGVKVDKTDLQVEAYGCVDELQSYLGIIRSLLAEKCESHAEFREMVADIEAIQNHLFDIGSLMASVPALREKRNIGHIESHISVMENTMDLWTEKLPPLNSFILSGEGYLTSSMHFARTICRSVERQVLKFHKQSPLPGGVLRYLNRLSDFLFVLARYTGMILCEKEILWKNGLPAK